MTKLYCKVTFCFGLLLASASVPQAWGQASNPPSTATLEATHDELRKLKDAAVAAINANAYEKILPLLHSNIVVTAENSEVVRSRDKVDQFYKKLLTGSEQVLKSFRIDELNVDELSILYGDNTAIAFGSGKFDYKFVNGTEFQLPCRWTATLVREGGQWVLAAFHNSVNVADNPVLDVARRTAYWFAVGGVIFGILLGALFFRLLSRRKG